MCDRFCSGYFVSKPTKMAKTFVLHDESVNSYGFWMLTSGVVLDQFKKNPIMLFNHNRSYRDTKDTILAIGHWENIRIEGTEILAEPVFDADEFSQTIAAKVESGTYRMASVGFRPILSSDDPQYIKPGQRYETHLQWKIKEASIVDIGSNENALALYDDHDNLVELSEGQDCPGLKLLTSNENNTEMKELAKILKLADGANEQAFIDAVNPVMSENVTLREDLEKERDAKKLLQDKVDAIELADRAAKTEKATALIDAALKDGRLNETPEATVKAFWVSSFETNYEMAEKALGALPTKAKVNQPVVDDTALTPWQKRQKEIEDKNKKK